ncbi:hypothetical protein GOP47_0017186 [Adiantum capillus-veneris]|uniref:Uncharacterized protein n=1 Tax=Adiantum capillus-veneris TaxID=13818 RepID=A0A9D4UJ46_ADICA|nr:hypothetical protein GOP47_0017186 [Adiantum capillus-veneris]
MLMPALNSNVSVFRLLSCFVLLKLELKRASTLSSVTRPHNSHSWHDLVHHIHRNNFLRDTTQAFQRPPTNHLASLTAFANYSHQLYTYALVTLDLSLLLIKISPVHTQIGYGLP